MILSAYMKDRQIPSDMAALSSSKSISGNLSRNIELL